MNFIERLLFALSGTMPTPESYGWFHGLFALLTLAATVFLCLRFRRASEKTERAIFLAGWGVIVLLELYKQLIFSVHFGQSVTWDYQWYAFPFQFCSSPLYVLPVAALAGNRRVKNAAMAFLATYSLFAGLAVYVYPNTVFIDLIGIDIQTMVHHGSQIVLGVFAGVRLLREKEWTLRSFAGGATLFSILLATALTLNCLAPLWTDETFNMFYVGPHFPCTLVVLDGVYRAVPHLVFLLIYFSGFTLLAFGIFGVYRGVAALAGRKSAGTGTLPKTA